ncbi:MAG: hypothetical protein EA426_18685 [Spirochaetaceae bacterium]|nr:MAG: hypothetical protein EA426_18685 [Spirochaetaceae bacterium]
MRTPKSRKVIVHTVFGALFFLATVPLFSQTASVAYFEGRPELRTGSATRDIDFGDDVRTGETVVTGRADLVELSQPGNNSIRISSNTVFTLREVERGGERETVMSHTVGSVRYRFQTLTGRGQQVGTMSAVAGVRGTEFEVFAGPDGATMILVDSGLVDVEAEGVTVEVRANEGIEVFPGQPPGEIFDRIGRPIDYSTWQTDRLDEYLADPVRGLERIRARGETLVRAMIATHELYLASAADLEAARARLRELQEDGTEEQLAEYRDTVANPIQLNTGNLRLNTRYYALSVLSLRRFVIGRMYMTLKTMFITDLDNPRYREYLALHHDILRDFEEVVVPQLNRADI